MNPTENQVEAQVFDDSADGPNHFFTVRNIAIAGTIIILGAGGLGYYYRKKLFGIGGTEVAGIGGTETGTGAGVLDIVNAQLNSFKEYNLDLTKDQLQQAIKRPGRFSVFFGNPKQPENFILTVKDSGDSGEVKSIKVDSIEKLFEEYAKEGRKVLSGVDETLFLKTGEKLILPVLVGRDTKLEEFESLEKLLLRLKDLVQGIRGESIDYEVFRRLRDMKEVQIKAQYPHVLDFRLPDTVEFNVKDYKPRLARSKDGFNQYQMRFKTMEDYGRARAAISVKYSKFDGQPGGVNYAEENKVHQKAYTLKKKNDKYALPIKRGGEVKEILYDDLQKFVKTLETQSLPTEFSGYEIDYANLYVW